MALCLALEVSAFAESKRRGDDCLFDAACSSLYEEARRLSKSGDLQAALVAYQAAYRRQPVPWLLINIGRTLQKLGRLQEALSHYQRYSAAEPNGPPDRQQMIREYTAQAEKSIADKSAPEATAGDSATAASSVEPPPQPLIVTPPPVVASPPPITATVPAPKNVNDQPGSAAPSEKRGMPAYFYAGIGVGGALLITGAITGGLALAQSHSLQDTPYAGPTPDTLLDEQTRVRGLAAATDALLVVGGVTVVAVTVAALVQRSRHRGTRSASAATAAIGVGGIVGRF